MGDLIGGTGTGTGTAAGGLTDLSPQMDFSMVFNLIWKIIFAIMQKAGLYTELAEYGIDLTKYINTDVNLLNK